LLGQVTLTSEEIDLALKEIRETRVKSNVSAIFGVLSLAIGLILFLASLAQRIGI
jgi:flagellar biogenesis protein FliO